MSMKLDALKDIMCDELDRIAMKGEVSAGDIETAHKLAATIKDIGKIKMLEEEGAYSEAGNWEASGNYGRGSSYANRGKHYVRGHYSRENGMNGGSSYGNYSRGRYSRTGYGNGGYSTAMAKEELTEQMEEMLNSGELSSTERDSFERAMEMIRNAR